MNYSFVIVVMKSISLLFSHWWWYASLLHLHVRVPNCCLLHVSGLNLTSILGTVWWYSVIGIVWSDVTVLLCLCCNFILFALKIEFWSQKSRVWLWSYGFNPFWSCNHLINILQLSREQLHWTKSAEVLNQLRHTTKLWLNIFYFC